MKIGLLSDTHGFIDDKVLDFMDACDEIWHAGDIGTLELANFFENYKPFRAVYGNIDNHDIRAMFPERQRFECEGVDVFMTHIGGYPGNYDSRIKGEMFNNPPKLFISGHSHILKVVNDKKLGLLHINPGAIGKSGFHQVRTAVRFKIEKGRISDLDVLEINR